MKLPVHVDWLLWAPLVFACLHIFEEFAWPGGFMSWYRRYRAGAASVKPRFLVIINALLLIGCFEGAVAGHNLAGAAYLLDTFGGAVFERLLASLGELQQPFLFAGDGDGVSAVSAPGHF